MDTAQVTIAEFNAVSYLIFYHYLEADFRTISCAPVGLELWGSNFFWSK